MKDLLLSLAIVGSVFGTVSRAPGFDVTACGQEVPEREIGVLMADIACSAEEHYGVYLEDHATLELNGFTLRGSAVGVGVQCYPGCRVIGPGTITGFDWGIRARGFSARVSDVTITDSVIIGLDARRLRLERSSITGCRGAWCEGGLVVTDKLTASDSTVSDNETDGIVAGGAVLRNVQVTGNAGFGVRSIRRSLPGIVNASGKVRAQDSVIVGNATACPPDQVPPCVDIQAYRVRLRNTVFGTCVGTNCP